jgi:hypothetical protein
MGMDPVTIGLLGAAIIGGTATAYSSNVSSKSAKTAADIQARAMEKQTEASLLGPRLAAEAARAKMKAKQASVTQTILTAPSGLAPVEGENTNQKSILGV